MKWSFYRKHIPNKVQVSSGVVYEILWVDEFIDNTNVGECRYDQQQVVLKKGLSHKQTLETYIHELLHLFSHEYGVDLSEQDVLKLEKIIPFILKENNIFKSRRHNDKRKATKRVRKARKKAKISSKCR